ncbi:MAG: FtsX-like permease family protein [Planctomycetota bacterium]
MYQATLTRRYLTQKVMPLLAALAVALCSAMVMTVWSVMGGFLDRFIDQGRTLVGDVAIVWPNAGFAHYEDLIERLEADPEIEAAAPMIESYGLVSLPGGLKETVVIKGIEGPGFDRVTGYADTIWWKPVDEPLPRDENREDWRLAENFPEPNFLRSPESWQRDFDAGLALTETELTPDGPRDRAAIVLGIEAAGFNVRRPSGVYVPSTPLVREPDGTTRYTNNFILDEKVVLHVVPLDLDGQAVELVTRSLPVANEFATGMFEVDNRVVFVRMDALQAMLGMDEAQRISADTPFDPFATNQDGSFAMPVQLEPDPARVSHVLARGIDRDMDAQRLKEIATEVYEAFAFEHLGEVPQPGRIIITTWADQNRTFIAAVEKETALVLFIFGFVSLTAVFLVLAIFWSMVSEKTRDVGILRALGASRVGIAWLWLRYGAAIGITGCVLGMILSYMVVTNINPIHDWLGAALGLQVWDPSVYYFTEIPNHFDPVKGSIIFFGGVLASVVGALIPAVRAAWLDPVKALRFE